MKNYMLRTLRAVKWFIIGALSMYGLFTSIVAITYGKKLMEEHEKKEEEPKGGKFEIYKARYHESKETDDIELGFH